MSVIISNGNTSLSTPNGFYRVEAYELGCFNTSVSYSLNVARVIPLTFANAGNCQGVVLGLITLQSKVTASWMKGVTVTLQENVAGTWTDRATASLTNLEIANSPDYYVSTGNGHGLGWLVPFEFSTPYAVDTTASKWRLSVISSGSGTGNWSLMTSNGSALFHAAWCDNAVSFTDGDCVISKDIVTIDQTATFGGVAVTGDTRLVCGMATRSLSPETDCTRFQWQSPAVASYTLTLTGLLVLSAHSGFIVGSEATPVPMDKPAIFVMNSGSGLYHPTVSHTYYAGGRQKIKFYGEYPTIEVTRLNGVHTTATNVLTVDDEVEWETGDKLFIGKCVAGGTPDSAVYEIASVSGHEITLTANLAANRADGAPVCVLNRRGVVISGTGQSALGIPNALVVSGVEWNEYIVSGASAAIATNENPACQEEWLFAHSTFTASATNRYCPYVDTVLSEAGWRWHHCYFWGSNLFRNLHWSTVNSLWTMEDCIACNFYARSTLSANAYWTVNRNEFYGLNITSYMPVIWCGANSTMTNNLFWGANYSAAYAVRIDGLFNTKDWSNNRFDNNRNGIRINSAIGFKSVGDKFGTEVPNTSQDIYLSAGNFIDAEFENITSNSPIVSDIDGAFNGSSAKFSSYNGNGDDHFTLTPYGAFQSCGDGLVDTTVHTSGSDKFSIRFAPNSSINNLYWKFNVPTGNIAGKTMTVAVWVKIKSAAYYAGTHQLPRLNINYDNGTVAYSQAAESTDWQLLSVTFTPVTTFGQLVVTIDGRTDATGTDAYFYVDDFAVLYPAGYKLDLGGLDLWASAMPIVPPIATVLSAKDVWTAATTEDFGAGTIGNQLKTLKNPSVIIDGEIIV